MLETPHVFAGNPLNRAEVERRDEAWLKAAPQHPEARFLPLKRLQVALEAPVPRSSGPARSSPTTNALRWLDANELNNHFATGTLALLGVTEAGAPRFAVEVTDEHSPATNCEFTDARFAAGALDSQSAGVVAQARAQINWHAKNGFCAECGSTTRASRGGQVRDCDNCESHIFPRTDPVVIMLVCDDTHCLLGRPARMGNRAPGFKMYSALAGFVDQAESIEEAVRREVMEEAGIRAGAVTYHSSQPWPFPSSLMIGCHAQPLTRDINFDDHEMADVRWFARDEVRSAFAGEQDFSLPGDIAIAHHLIMHWLDQD